MTMDFDKVMVTINEAVKEASDVPEWKKALMSARLEICSTLLIYSYHALALPVPSDEIIMVRASQIADRADVSNRQLKDAFFKALDVKMEKELRTPITYGDVVKGAKLVCEETGGTIVGKWKNALPSLSDGSLWGESVKAFARTFGRAELDNLVCNGQRKITNG